jgi:hypothetical protein
MPRIPGSDINYAEVGRLVLDLWSNTKSASEFEAEIKAKINKAYADIGASTPQVSFHYEGPDELIISVPYNPWQSDPDKFDCAKDMSSYQNELGVVIFGGCR